MATSSNEMKTNQFSQHPPTMYRCGCTGAIICDFHRKEKRDREEYKKRLEHIRNEDLKRRLISESNQGRDRTSPESKKKSPQKKSLVTLVVNGEARPI